MFRCSRSSLIRQRASIPRRFVVVGVMALVSSSAVSIPSFGDPLMSSYDDFIASVLDHSASAYAGYAASRLLESQPDLETQFAPDAFGNWRGNLTRRLQDLAMAVELDSPSVFAATVDWSRDAFAARELSMKVLHDSLVTLQEVLQKELPQSGSPRIGRCFEAAFDSLARTAGQAPALDPQKPLERLILTYLQACLEGDAQRATREVLDAIARGLPVQQAYLHVVTRAQEEVGRLWHQGKLAIHEEHFVTTTSARLLTLLSHRLPAAPSNGYTVIGATIHGNAHELAIRVLTDLFGAAGWRSICLGSSLPASDLAVATREFRADLLVLSVSMVPQFKPLKETIRAVRLESPRIKILVGGIAFDAAPQAWKWAGADERARGVEEAIATGNRLVETP